LSLSATEQVKTLKVLTVGNSFANSVFQELPAVAGSDPSCKLILKGANLGGCSLQRHWEEHLKSEKDPNYKAYQKKTMTLRELLANEKWDVVTIQQVSHLSWMPETYQPYADNLIKLIKEVAPSAEIVIQQTWSYNSGTPNFLPAKNLNQTQMYEKLTESYIILSKKYNFRVIPSGLAVQLYRKAMGDQLNKIDNAIQKTMKQPDLPANNDLVGNFSWSKDKENGQPFLQTDWIHLNNDGKYLQALVWFGILFGKEPQKVTYVPKGMKPEKADLLKKCAAEAIAQFPQVK